MLSDLTYKLVSASENKSIYNKVFNTIQILKKMYDNYYVYLPT